MLKYFSVIIFIFLAAVSIAQKDSSIIRLKKSISLSENDTNKIKLFFTLCEELQNKQPDSTIIWGQKGIKLATELKYDFGVAQLLNSIGIAYKNKADYSEAYQYYLKALDIFTRLNHKVGIANSYSNLGNIFSIQSDYSKAMQYFFKSLKMQEDAKNYNGVGNVSNNIGIIFLNLRNYDKALEYFNKAIDIYNSNGIDKKMYSNCLNNISNVYLMKREFDKSLEFANKSLKLKKEIGNKKGIVSTIVNIGNIFYGNNQNDSAFFYYKTAADLAKEIGDKNSLAASFVNIAEILSIKGDFQKADEYYNNAIDLALKTGSVSYLRNCYEGKYQNYKKKGDLKGALLYHEKYKEINDSLYNTDNNAKFLQLEMTYEFDKKIKEKEVVTRQKELLQSEEIKKQKIIRNAFIIGFILLIIFIFFLWKSIKRIQILNKTLEIQKSNIKEQAHLLELANSDLEKKNKQITDSINYARVIQDAISPSINQIQNIFPESYIFYKPRDIVSGDFYWYHFSNRFFYFASGDCTGHGVPGSLLSMIGNTLLNNIIKTNEEIDLATLLQQLNTELNSMLQQNGMLHDEGMDITILKLNLEDFSLTISAANQDAFIFNKSGSDIIKGDIFSIGGVLSNRIHHNYQIHNLKITEPTSIYFCSDGYQDQFNDSYSEKLGAERLLKLFNNIHHLNAEQQKTEIENTFINWKGSNNQTDDILISCIRINPEFLKKIPSSK